MMVPGRTATLCSFVLNVFYTLYKKGIIKKCKYIYKEK